MGNLKQLHKFGGSSLANAECFSRVANILAEYSNVGDLVIVSAAGSTTNNLLRWLAALEKDGRIAHEILLELRAYQNQLIVDLLPEDKAELLQEALNNEFTALRALNAPMSESQKSAALGHGEVWSSRLLAALLSDKDMDSVAIDSRDFLRAEIGTQPEIDRGLSWPLAKSVVAQHPHRRLVVTGFMAQNQEGETVLLGRNGSDYSATIVGALAEVSKVTIWSDVAGVYSADPRIVGDACLLPLLRLDEASELARLAAPVLHSRTLQPVAQSTMDMELRCSHQPESGSTRIERVLASGRGAKIVTSLDDVNLIELTLSHAHDFERLEPQVLSLLNKAQLAPLAYESQSDNYCLRLAYTSELLAGALECIESAHLEVGVEVKSGMSLIAAVGAGVTNNANHCFGFYQTLKGVPVEFMFETDSELSLIAVVRTNKVPELLESLHNQLFQAQKRVGIVLCGKGNIGSNWIELFAQQKIELEKRRGMSFDLIAVVASNRYWFDENGIDAGTLNTHFAEEAVVDEEDWVSLVRKQSSYDEIVVLDVTASQEVSDRYLEFAEHGMHVISANKLAGSAPSEFYHQVQDVFAKTGRHWLYNATVGAGLPVNHTVRDLRESGDQIVAISGIFSGTLSWLFQQYDGSIPFSELVDLAWQQGLTEPDPRADLDGTDVMRKLVILARESGLDLEPEGVKVESLVPKELLHLSVDDFFHQAHVLNELLAERLDKAQSEGKVLRYVARLSKDGEATVGVEALDEHHALANLLPCDNIFAIESKWYKDNPLVIRGPGAGREVTAGALQSDLNRLSGLL
ncbi:bifunctional aspartate kinase/homoserine dehydrogenase II [Vibrio breoganii]|uniref:bifunctional aspartate kinase/homoserine dehydrogenase II n=1 Tax=Vibrio breoganii TaxID=553239 RepID=UPI000C81DDEE|nr:bifunctional aspartate kinase/homoserine dehydrogenase II [Vibrio breoganii]PMF86861.1 bifunctional aspartate kinase/homoserine dehydrogenase II [Vibrio breoganii]PMH18622.1 bifunctional aspartate kinase/homoserine dehydrogenase II [Vibrio breoganii]PMK63044.1 bifunctional aspartate kinase/homoserine dehydrogenase II [Vibrio breoganii]PMK73940.1 bifunctional aspartate kinase/homoserine dehydrogenase II [Vibrio breoganii]PMM14724.1 bifunctional aspartate kinase/homoserine dehydrogenase II [V